MADNTHQAAFSFLSNISLGRSPVPKEESVAAPTHKAGKRALARTAPAVPGGGTLMVSKPASEVPKPVFTPPPAALMRAATSVQAPAAQQHKAHNEAIGFLTSIKLGTPDEAEQRAHAARHAALLRAQSQTAVGSAAVHNVVMKTGSLQIPRGPASDVASSSSPSALPQRGTKSPAAAMISPHRIVPPTGREALELFISKSEKRKRHRRVFLTVGGSIIAVASYRFRPTRDIAAEAASTDGASSLPSTDIHTGPDGSVSAAMYRDVYRAVGGLSSSEETSAISEYEGLDRYLQITTTTRRATSYKSMLMSSWIQKKTAAGDAAEAVLESLDDPYLRSGRHHVVMRLAGWKSSILPYVRPEELKVELDEQFRQKHPDIDEAGVTLSRLRKAKTLILKAGRAFDADLSSIALAHALIERTIRSGHTKKSDIKLHPAVCMYLAAKFNQPWTSRSLSEAREAICKVFRVESSAVLQNEFPVFASLGLSLFLDPDEVAQHYDRLVRLVEREQAEAESDGSA